MGQFVLTTFMLLYSTAIATEIKSSISQNTIWTKTSSPYYMVASILVNEGVTLEIEPGVIIYSFNKDNVNGSGYRLTVAGKLKANGTIDDSIYFKGSPPENDTAYPASYQSWPGIWLSSSTDDTSSSMNFCNLMNSNSGISCIGSAPTIRNCYVEGQVRSLLFTGSVSLQPKIEYCIIKGTERAIIISGPSPTIFSNRIQGNYNSFVCYKDSRGEISYNDIYGAFGVDPDSIYETINAENNYWGASTEDSILNSHYFNGKVDYTPWLTEDYNDHASIVIDDRTIFNRSNSVNGLDDYAFDLLGQKQNANSLKANTIYLKTDKDRKLSPFLKD